MASVAAAIAAAKSKLGAPYVWGAIGPSTFDCSGLTQWAWKQAGVSIPRTSQQQATYGTAVKLSEIQAGDLITSDWGSGPSSHVAMYVGGGQVIHAPRPGRTITYAKLDAAYAKHINAIRRVPGSTGAPVSDGAQFADFSWDDLSKLNPLGPEYWGLVEKGLNSGGLTGTVLEPLVDIGKGAMSMAHSMLGIGGVATMLLKLALPTTWVRIVAGLLGAMFLLLGLGFLIRETKAAG